MLKHLARCVREFKWAAILSPLCMIGEVSMEVMIPLVMAKLYDHGITMQNIHGQMLPEVGYHIRADRQRKGYATEAAAACIRYAFEKHNFPAVYSYMKHTNIPSQRTAMKNGMRFVEEYEDPDNIYTRVYVINRKEWEEQHETQCANGFDFD